MDIKYLSVLITVRNFERDYVLAVNKKDDFKSFIMDKVDFGTADKNNDGFLSYNELKNIKLSIKYDIKKDTFKFTNGLNLLSDDLMLKIIQNKGLSFNTLEEYLKSFDKNKDGKIEIDEINKNIKKEVSNAQREYREYKFKNLKHKDYKSKKLSNIKQQIEAIDKQIENLKKMLKKLKTIWFDSQSFYKKNDIKKTAADSLDRNILLKTLKNKYGEDDINKLVNVINSTKSPQTKISQIVYQSGTNATENEVASLVENMQNVVLNKIDTDNTQKENAIEQFSPANTLLILDTKNIDFTISAIEQKIEALEEIRDKLIQMLYEEIQPTCADDFSKN